MPRGVGLDAAAVVDAAERIADTHGLDGLDLTRLADACGVRKPSLYKHVDGLPAIRDALAVRAATRLRDVLSGVPEPEGLVGLALAWRAFARAHPGLHAALGPTHVGRSAEVVAASAELLDALRARLRAAGVAAGDEVHAARALRALVVGFAALEAVGGFGLDGSVEDSFRRAVDALVRGW